jgi:hypothetical protein
MVVDTILKVESQGDIRRTLIKGVPSFAGVDQGIQWIWPGRRACETRYEDDEGDLCILSELTFSDFLFTAKTSSLGQILKLQLRPEGASSVISIEDDLIENDLTSDSHVGSVISAEDHTSEEDHTSHLSFSSAEIDENYLTEEEHSSDLNCNHDEYLVSMDDDFWVRVQKIADLEVDILASKNDNCTASSESHVQEEQDVVVGAVSTRDITESSEAVFGIAEQVDMILAAFDKNSDGRVDFEESNELHKLSWGSSIPWQTFQQICAGCGVDPTSGICKQSLLQLYSNCEVGALALSRDFEVSRVMLEGGMLQEPLVAGLNPAWWRDIRSYPFQAPSWPSSDAARIFSVVQNKVISGSRHLWLKAAVESRRPQEVALRACSSLKCLGVQKK